MIWVLLAALAAALIWLLAPVLSPFFLAWVLAYATEPVVSFMSAPRASARPGARHWRLPRALAVLLVELASICVVAVLVLVVTTILRVQVPQLQEQLPVLLGKVAAGLSPMLARWGIDVPSDAQSLKTMILHGLSSNGAGLGATLLSSVRLGGGLAVTLIGHLVLVPLVWHDSGPTVLLTRRTESLSTHAGQVSFPGGRVDDTDESPLAAALRETHEETGITPNFVRVVGYMDGYETGTGFAILPVVGVVKPGFTLMPNPAEVHDIFEVPLSFLLDPKNRERQSREWQGKRREFYAFNYGSHYIWGATAAILVNFAERFANL